MSQKFKSDIEVQAGLRDSSGSLGTSGQVLSTTGTSVAWINENQVAHTISNQVKAGVAINKGQAVYVTGADGTNIIVGLASNTSEATSSKTLGLLDATVATNGFANVIENGRLPGLNTLGANAGDPVWLGVNGNLIYGLANKPYAPAHLVFIGIVTRVNANNGEIFVNVQNGFELKEIHDVDIVTNVPINGDVLGYDGTLWVNKTIAEWLGYTPANASGTTNYVSKFTGSTTLGNSQIFDNGTNVGIGTTAPNRLLTIAGTTSGLIALNASSYRNTTIGSDSVGNFIVHDDTDGVYRMVINSSGNVGIGTTSPYEKLEVNGNIGLPKSGETFIYNTTSGSDSISIGGASYISFKTFGAFYSERMRITSSGNVGIGTSSPSALLNVIGDVHLGSYSNSSTVSLENRTSKGVFNISTDGVTNAAGTTITYSWVNGGHGPLKFNNASGEVMRLEANGNVGIGTSAPTSKLTVNDSTAFSWGFPSLASAKIGTSGAGGSFMVMTPSLNSSYESGFAVDGTYDSGKSVINLSAFGVYSGGPYSADIAFKTATNTTLSEKMRITNDGNVGIGTDLPSEKLQVVGQMKIGDPSTYDSILYDVYGANMVSSNIITGLFVLGDSFITRDVVAGTVAFKGGGMSEVMRFNSSNNVGIGTSSPSEKLEVNGVIKASGGNSNEWNSAPKIIYLNVNDGTLITGTTALSIGQSVLIPANTFSGNGLLEILFRGGQTTIVSGCQFRFYKNTTNSLTGATLVGTVSTLNTSQAFAQAIRTFRILSNNMSYVPSSQNVPNDYTITATAQQSTTFDVTVDNYIIISIQNGSVSDATRVNMIRATKFV